MFLGKFELYVPYETTRKAIQATTRLNQTTRKHSQPRMVEQLYHRPKWKISPL